ncbi:MAG: hypothetical protein LBQ84_03675 [Flavobacteriaceae bacterium]|jgi:hypothetical protein|nr:hypothetical protein [Flavobacteriaceae bacterium]
MEKVYFILLMTILCALPSTAQVAVGGQRPEPGTIIDLNSPNSDNNRTRGGLLLSNVTLTDLADIPTSFPGITSANKNTTEIKKALTGMMIWNIGNASIKKGVYIWDSEKWVYIGG